MEFNGLPSFSQVIFNGESPSLTTQTTCTRAPSCILAGKLNGSILGGTENYRRSRHIFTSTHSPQRIIFSICSSLYTCICTFFFILNFVVRQILTVRRGTVGRGRILFSVFFLFPFSIRFFFFFFFLLKNDRKLVNAKNAIERRQKRWTNRSLFVRRLLDA